MNFKKIGLVVATFLLFVLVNTRYFWDAKLEAFALPVFIALILVFFVLCALVVIQILFLFAENFRNIKRLFTVVFVTFILILIFLRPRGVIDFYKFEAKDVLFAQREGVANCMTTLQLKENNTFKERSVCFGVSEVTGSYRVKNDTIFFHDINLNRSENSYYEYAVIKPSIYEVDRNAIMRYEEKDSIGSELWVVFNKLDNEIPIKQNH
ncbi:hypothetical protein [Aquimarina litoralis]|uniref:hypothetical protein n=1 Tax=Aquimarina litoralis TaxID=584605 RepID=UPI001C577E55|nr:hypothetical protein [Aquimarina litoralis]MBW1294992.1 hypothetical protein [Aquimarina litoralis]